MIISQPGSYGITVTVWCLFGARASAITMASDVVYTTTWCRHSSVTWEKVVQNLQYTTRNKRFLQTKSYIKIHSCLYIRTKYVFMRAHALIYMYRCVCTHMFMCTPMCINQISHDSVYEPSQGQTTLHCNVVSHWLGAHTKWSLGFSWLPCIHYSNYALSEYVISDFSIRESFGVCKLKR